MKDCIDCERLSYHSDIVSKDEGDGSSITRSDEGYGFCKIKCSWVTLTSSCIDVALCNHAYFKAYPEKREQIAKDWKECSTKNLVEYDLNLIRKSVVKDRSFCQATPKCNPIYSSCVLSDSVPKHCTHLLMMARKQRIIKHPLKYEAIS